MIQTSPARGDHEQALPLFERAIAIRSARLGAEDPRMIELFEPYESYLRDIGELEQADEVSARIEEIRVRDA